MDVWDQDVNDLDFERIIQKNSFEKEKEKRYKIGFQDALDHHEQEAARLQKEFEKGVVDSFNKGLLDHKKSLNQ